MAHFRTSAVSPATAAEAFDFMANFQNLADWDPGVSTSYRLDDGEIGIGSTFHVDSVIGPKTIPLVYEVVEYDAPRRIVLQASTGDFTSYDVLDVDEHEGGVVITYDATLTLHGYRRIFDPLLAAAFQIIGRRAAAGLTHAAAHLQPVVIEVQK